MAIKSQGVVISIGTEEIGEITGWTGPNETAKQVDVTSLESTAREYMSGLKDGGEVSIEFNFDPANAGQKALKTALDAGTSAAFTITLTDAATTPTEIGFNAIVTAHQIKGGVDEAVKATASLKISGAATFTYHTP